MLRFVPKGTVEGIDGGRLTSRSLPPAAFWETGTGGERGRFPKKGFSRDESLERVRAEPAVLPAGWLRGLGGFVERKRVCFRPPARLPAVPGGQSAPTFYSLRDGFKIRRANSEALLPAGQTASIPHTGNVPLPAGQGSVAQRMPLQTAGPCSWACRRLLLLPLQPKRNAAPMPPTRGAWARLHGAEGVGSRHCRLDLRAARRPIAPAEQGIAAPALKTLVCRLFFPLCAVLPFFSVQEHAIEPQLHFRSCFCTEGIVGQQGEMTLPCPAGKGRPLTNPCVQAQTQG